MQDAWRAYLEMALGLTEEPRRKVQKAAGDLINRGGETAAQLQGLVADVVGAGLANREALTTIVRYEVDRALGLVGLATAEEVADLTNRVRDLERQLRDARARAAAGAVHGVPAPVAGATDGDAPGARTATSPAKKAVAKKAVAKKAVGKQTVAKTAVAKKAVAKAVPRKDVTPETVAANAGPSELVVGKAVAKKAVAKKAVAKKAVAKAAVAKKAVAKKAMPNALPSAATTQTSTPAPTARKAAKKAASAGTLAKSTPAKVAGGPGESAPANPTEPTRQAPEAPTASQTPTFIDSAAASNRATPLEGASTGPAADRTSAQPTGGQTAASGTAPDTAPVTERTTDTEASR
ncbi:phasin family protein [Krasilnikovia sp. MM14-A1004]|uniref:phasin family protein n=1 Tax=Krasilnikovia sp. MM14-A1004 TaxID=3373541 RepID=UPI00399CA055